MINEQYGIILFDGVCNLCNYVVRFIIRHDKKERFRFVAAQSDKGKILLKANGIEENSLNSIFYFKKEKVFIQSDAALKILFDLGYPYKLFYPFIFLPRFIRDNVYTLIARNRYLLFGKKEECMLPDENNKIRFLGYHKD